MTKRKGFHLLNKKKSAPDAVPATRWVVRRMQEMSAAEVARLTILARQYLSAEAVQYRREHSARSVGWLDWSREG